MESFLKLKSELKEFRINRELLLNNIQGVLNIKNKLTYMTSSMIYQSIGPIVTTSKASYIIEQQLNIEIEDIIITQSKLLNNICNIKEFMNTLLFCNNPNVIPIDINFLNKFVFDIQQQFSLENSIIDQIKDLNKNMNIDTDHIVTMIACFEYPPYAHFEDLDAIINIP